MKTVLRTKDIVRNPKSAYGAYYEYAFTCRRKATRQGSRYLVDVIDNRVTWVWDAPTGQIAAIIAASPIVPWDFVLFDELREWDLVLHGYLSSRWLRLVHCTVSFYSHAKAEGFAAPESWIYH